MKKIYFITFLLGWFYSTKAQIISAALDVASTTKAFYPPRMTTVQKNAIVSPQAGAVVYDTDLQTLCSYNGTTWTCYTPQKAIPNGARGDFRLGKMLNSNTGSGYESFYECKADASGNFYLLGSYAFGNLAVYNFDGTSPLTLPNAGSSDVYLTKYDTNGMLLWGARLAGTGSDDGISMTVDAAGVTIAGTFKSTPMTIYNGRATTGAAETSWGTLAATSASISDGFVVRYNTAGTVQLAARASGPSIDDASVSSDGSNLYVGFTKSSATNVTIYNGRSSSGAAETSWGTQSFTNTNSSFVVKYTIATGAVAWVAKADGSNLFLDDLKVVGGSLFVDYDANNATFYGAITTSVGVPSNWGTMTSLGNADTFLVKMDAAAGGITWVARQGGANTEYGNTLATDASGNVYVSNLSKTSVATPLSIFNARATSAAAEVSWGGLTIEGDALGTTFIAKYNSSGTVVWSTNMTGTGTSISSISGLGLAVDASQNVYVAGSYNSTLLNVYNSKSTGSSTQSLFNTAPAIAASTTKGFLVKFNSLGKGEWLDRPTGPQNLIQAIDVYSNTTLFGLAGAIPGTVNLGSQSITLSAASGDVFFFKYTEGN